MGVSWRPQPARAATRCPGPTSDGRLGRDGINDDAIRLALALRDAGVEVGIDVCEGAIHGYHMFAPETPEAREGMARLAAFLDARLA
jgi:acetyl esterase/lipase